jgi:hypothetical protein
MLLALVRLRQRAGMVEDVEGRNRAEAARRRWPVHVLLLPSLPVQVGKTTMGRMGVPMLVSACGRHVRQSGLLYRLLCKHTCSAATCCIQAAV